MRRTAWRRVVSLVLALAFLAGSGRSLLGLHACLHHPGAVADEVEGVAHAEGHHHHAASGVHGAEDPAREAGAGSSHSHHDADSPCTCLGTCVSAPAAAVPGTTTTRSADLLSALEVDLRDGTGRMGPRYAPWELPPSTAPPAPLLATPGV